ncbi:MAG: hypothetical protein JSS97_07295 [Actinobacteria bacterium]|nr:hypothetical protein [Actinomycetota bacterium]
MSIDTPEVLEAYRHQLHDAIERDLARPGPSARPRRRALAIAVPAAVAAVTAAVLLLSAGGAAGPSLTGGGPSLAEAAIIHHIRAQLTAPGGSILHEAATVTPTGGSPMQFELWEQTGGTGVYRVIKYGTEASQSATQNETYDPSTRTVTVSPLPPAVHAREVAHSVDLAGKLKEMVNSGQATATATTFDGIPAYEIQVDVSGDQQLSNATAYVAQSDYRPLEIDSSKGKAVFSTYEYLPATPANEALLAVTTAHPGAKVVNEAGTG